MFEFRDDSGASTPDCLKGITLLVDEDRDGADIVPIKIEIERKIILHLDGDGESSPILIPCVPTLQKHSHSCGYTIWCV